MNAYAANFLQGANFANEVISPTPWPAANMQMTLFDEAEVGADKNFTLNSQDLPNVRAAQDLQTSQLGANMGTYNLLYNNCLSGPANILRAGGADIPNRDIYLYRQVLGK